jgi:hypothetical protein
MPTTRILTIAFLAAALAACGGKSTPSGDPSDNSGLAAFCSAGARIGDTSVLTDVDSSDAVTFERTYDATIATLAQMIPNAPTSAEAQVQAGHDLLVEFRVELEAVEWNAPDLSPEASVRWINLPQELIEVSPAIRAACS